MDVFVSCAHRVRTVCARRLLACDGMAYVVERKDKRGNATYRVRWREGGARTAPWHSEKFDNREAAEIFLSAVEEADQRWPVGWVPGIGYVGDGALPANDMYLFRNFALQVIATRTGVSERYRQDCIRDLERYVFPTFGDCDVRSAADFSRETVGAWVNELCRTWVWRGSRRKLMSPKTVRGLHALLSMVLQAAVGHEPPLRDRNPCRLTRLPRTDDDGGGRRGRGRRLPGARRGRRDRGGPAAARGPDTRPPRLWHGAEVG
ncbi:hypothetical protein GCM10018787_27860 [Streptomyces thermodiastaticus]|nr:hypothetical protein GCM10018787_27860 [Streptomyces thermodiastaticus]